MCLMVVIVGSKIYCHVSIGEKPTKEITFLGNAGLKVGRNFKIVDTW